MTRDETKAMLQKISIHYWQHFKDLPKEYMSIILSDWYRLLGKYDVRVVEEALYMYLEKGQFPPKISDMIECIAAVSRQNRIENSINQPKLESPGAIETPEELKKVLEGWRGKN